MKQIIPLLSFFRMFLVMLVLGTIVSCLSMEPTKDRGSLSDAMDKARDDNQGDRQVPDYDIPPESDDPWDDETHDSSSGQPAGEYSGTGVSPTLSGGGFGFRLGFEPQENVQMRAQFEADVLLLMEFDRYWELVFYGGLKPMEAIAGTSLDSSVKGGLFLAKAGGELHLVPFPDLPVGSPYLSAGFGALYMGWQFRNTLISGSETIESDAVNGIILNIGLGVYLVRLPEFSLGVSAMPEIYGFGDKTQEGFTNDYFGGRSALRLGIEAIMRFK